MQGKVLAAMFLVCAIGAIAYLRSMGPRCGDERCPRGQYCEEYVRGTDEEYRCLPLTADCGLFPDCSCTELGPDTDCDSNVFGYVHVRMTD